METLAYNPNESYLRLATACPEVSLADVATNVENITALYEQACAEDVSLVTFPELSITGYSIQDLVSQKRLQTQALAGLEQLAAATAERPTAMVVGLPLSVDNGTYNCAAVLANGKIQGIVPKSNLPSYHEFYESRWFTTWEEDQNTTISIGNQEVPFGTDMVFEIGDVKCGVEICEDAWVLEQPGIAQAAKGALVTVNPSASPEHIGKSPFRHDLVKMHSALRIGAYAYAGCDVSESTAETIMSGHQLIAANGHMEAERQPFGEGRLLIADVDIDHLEHDRRVQKMKHEVGGLVVKTGVKRQQTDLRATIERNPFLPEESAEAHASRLEQGIQIMSNALAQRMRATKQEKVILGLSGGLDSTLALLIAHRALQLQGKDPAEALLTITMPGPASSDTTQSNAQQLAKLLGAANEVIPISELSEQELAAIGHNGVDQDPTYENVQARARTNILFNKGNHVGGLILGTGDFTELLLGWCTYNGDQQSHYAINATIPKSMVRELVLHQAAKPAYKPARKLLREIAHQVISPELTTAKAEGINQSTEESLGPLAVHEFIGSYVLRWGDAPEKVRYLADRAFQEVYDATEIQKAFDEFTKRVLRNQFKRNNIPDGPMVGSIGPSPRGYLRWPSDLPNNALLQ